MKAALFASDLEQFILQPKLTSLRRVVDSELAKLGPTFSHFKLGDQMNYAVLSSGKRLRPIMTLLSVRSVGGKLRDARDLALAVEIMHAATLVHDDILDNDLTRRGAPTVHQKWSVNEAILTGDALLSLSLCLIVGYREEILEVFAETGLLLAEGEYMDLDPSLPISEDDYLGRIKRKSASLFKAATKCGALAGNGSSLEVKTLAAFGENLGMAYQIRDDILDILSFEGSVSKDLAECRVTLPIVHLYGIVGDYEKTEIVRCVRRSTPGEGLKDRTCFERITTLLEENGSLDYCIKKIDHYVDEALASIHPLKNSRYKTCLTELAEAIRLGNSKIK